MFARFEVFTAVKIRGLLGCDGMQCCSRIPTFRGSMLPPPSGWRDLWNVVTLRKNYTVSQPRRPRFKTSFSI